MSRKNWGTKLWHKNTHGIGRHLKYSCHLSTKLYTKANCHGTHDSGQTFGWFALEDVPFAVFPLWGIGDFDDAPGIINSHKDFRIPRHKMLRTIEFCRRWRLTGLCIQRTHVVHNCTNANRAVLGGNHANSSSSKKPQSFTGRETRICQEKLLVPSRTWWTKMHVSYYHVDLRFMFRTYVFRILR